MELPPAVLELVAVVVAVDFAFARCYRSSRPAHPTCGMDDLLRAGCYRSRVVLVESAEVAFVEAVAHA